MSEPVLIDVRDGLTAEAVEALRQAERIQYAVKQRVQGQRAVGVGLLSSWPEDDRSDDVTQPVVLLVEADPAAPADSQVLLDVPGQRRGGPWERVAGALRPGDRLRLDTGPLKDRRRGCFRLQVQGASFRAAYSLPILGGSWTTVREASSAPGDRPESSG